MPTLGVVGRADGARGRRGARREGGVTVRLAAVIAAIGLLVMLGQAYGYGRAAGAGLMFAVVLAYGLRLRRKFVSIPPEPEPADVSEFGLKYVCTVCGLELKVEIAARDKPPSHCMEPMVLLRAGTPPGARPPLRPVR